MPQFEIIREVIITQVVIEVVMEGLMAEAEITGHIEITIGMNVENVAEQTIGL